ncbi:MAG: ABC transporter permease subunit [Phycisphaeraceae bacterium]|nr:ABC transporter permease subunit [Phycisphaeraceae bacterium]
MMRGLTRSRGWRKLKRNRSARVASVIILIYLLIGAFIVVTETVDWIDSKFRGPGERTFLQSRPVLGLLLERQTTLRVGANDMGSSLLKPEPEDLLRINLSYLKDWGNVLGLEPGSAAQLDLGDQDAIPPEIRDGYAYAERRLVDAPFGEVRAIWNQGDSIRTRQANLEKAADKLRVIRRDLQSADLRRALQAEVEALGTAKARLTRAQASGGNTADIEDDILLHQEEIAFKLLDIAEPLAEVLRIQHAAQGERDPPEDARDEAEPSGDEPPAAEANPLEAIHGEIAALADAIESGDDAVLPGEDLFARADAAIADQPTHLRAASATLASELDQVMLRLLPIPDGFSGFMYRLRTSLGTDSSGRSVFVRAFYSIKTAIQIGVVVALMAVVIGSLMGAAAAFFSGWVDHGVIWVYSTFSSIPYLVLMSVLSFAIGESDMTIPFTESRVANTLIPLYVAMGLTFWIGPCRVIRGEALKVKQLEYVQAATAIGFARFSILLRHILPNTIHLMLINFSLLFISAIKAEVILTFLGLGVKNGASWGLMISMSKEQILAGNFWQLGSATVLMLIMVLAFNVLSDALQDAFDPKHAG